MFFLFWNYKSYKTRDEVNGLPKTLIIGGDSPKLAFYSDFVVFASINEFYESGKAYDVHRAEPRVLALP